MVILVMGVILGARSARRRMHCCPGLPSRRLSERDRPRAEWLARLDASARRSAGLSAKITANSGSLMRFRDDTGDKHQSPTPLSATSGAAKQTTCRAAVMAQIQAGLSRCLAQKAQP